MIGDRQNLLRWVVGPVPCHLEAPTCLQEQHQRSIECCSVYISEGAQAKPGLVAHAVDHVVLACKQRQADRPIFCRSAGTKAVTRALER